MSEKSNIKGWGISIIMALSLVIFATNSCTEKQSLEEKAVNDVKEYNRRYCPTPAVNYIRTDSITFDAKKHCFTYHCSFCDLLDNPDVVAFNKVTFVGQKLYFNEDLYRIWVSFQVRLPL